MYSMKTEMSEKLTPGKNIRTSIRQFKARFLSEKNSRVDYQSKRKKSCSNSRIGGKRRRCETVEINPNSGSEVKKVRYLAACESNLVDEVRLLLDSGADVNWRREEDGQTGLHLAALYNYQELLELLLAQTGVKVNISDQNYRTPVMTACLVGHGNIVRRLCRAQDINLNCRDDNGLTALHFAVKFNPCFSETSDSTYSSDCVSVLRKANARVDWNARTDDGRYPVTMAVFSGNAEVLQTILSVGEPALDLSVISPSNRNIAQLAVESYALDSLRCVELLSRDTRVNWSINNRYGETPLMYCMKNNKPEMAKIILEMEERFETKQPDRSDAKLDLEKKEPFIKHESIMNLQPTIKLEINE